MHRKALGALMAVRSIGVLGAGQMGAGIAQVASCSGYPVTMVDIDENAVEVIWAN